MGLIEYLRRCKGLVNSSYNKIVVIGNESCDLDSAVCSIVFAFFSHLKPTLFRTWYTTDTIVLPVINVHRNELALKTEVTFFLKQHGVGLEDLVCKNEFDWEKEETSKIVLVDHHVTNLKQKVIGIYDHRPLDSNFNAASMDAEGFRTIELVGSCATLIGREIMKNCVPQETREMESLLNLLYGAIVLDTVNFSKEADKAKRLDHEVAEYIENLNGIGSEMRQKYRCDLFHSLVGARSDVSELNAYQLLHKDLKTVSINNRIVTLPGFPMAVQDYLNLPDRKEHLTRFASTTNSNVVILLGMKVLPDGSVRRDIGVIPIDDESLSNKINLTLLENKEMDFALEKIQPSCHCEGTFYQQHNLKASRKQLMPIVISVLNGTNQ